MEFDKRFTVTVGSTEVSEKGQLRIKRMLRIVDLPPLSEDWSWSRCVQEGKFRGKFPRRVATYYKKEHGEGISIELLTSIGNRVDQHSFKEGTYLLNFTEDLGWSAGDFGDHGSCFWGCRELAREALMKNDVFAVKFYRDRGTGYARAFVLRVNDGLIVFNAYGLPCRTIAYVLATLFDYPHRKGIELYINGDYDGLIWLNEDAYQIGLTPPANIVTVKFDVPYAWCSCCEDFYPVEQGEYDDYDGFRCLYCSKA
jgi:hypothetical protein